MPTRSAPASLTTRSTAKTQSPELASVTVIFSPSAAWELVARHSPTPVLQAGTTVPSWKTRTSDGSAPAGNSDRCNVNERVIGAPGPVMRRPWDSDAVRAGARGEVNGKNDTVPATGLVTVATTGSPTGLLTVPPASTGVITGSLSPSAVYNDVHCGLPRPVTMS